MLLAAAAAQSPALPPQYNAVRFSFTFFFGLLLGTTFWRIGQDRCAQRVCWRIRAHKRFERVPPLCAPHVWIKCESHRGVLSMNFTEQ